MLRTTIHFDGFSYKARVHPPYAFHIPTHDLSSLPHDDQEEAVEVLVERSLSSTFDTEALPLFRITAIQISHDEWVLIQVEHHIIHDGRSIGRLWQEIQDAYVAIRSGGTPSLPALPIQYQHYVAWQRKKLQGTYGLVALDFWERYLTGSNFDVRLSRSDRDIDILSGHNIRQRLPADTYENIQTFARSEKTSVYAAMLSVFALMIARRTGIADFCIGTGAAARINSQLEPIIGMIVNTIPVRAKLADAYSFRSASHILHASLVNALKFQDIPLPLIATKLKVVQSGGRSPIFQHCFSFHDSDMPTFDFGTAKGEIYEEQNRTAKFDINVIVVPPGDTRGWRHARILWEFSSDRFSQREAESLSLEYLALLNAGIADPDRPLAREKHNTNRAQHQP